MTTLLVDDDPFALKLLARQLEQLGWADVTLCEHAADALALLEAGNRRVGMVFCDLQMPGIDGVEFVRHLARLDFRGGLVLVSGEDSRLLQSVQRLAQAHRIHVLGVVPKPVSPEHLRQVLIQVTRAAPLPPPGSARHTADDLRRAIQRGELVIHYQPKVQFSDGALTGVEALVRWQHPEEGLVFPDQFIALAEEHGLIDELTRVVLAGALKQARRWKDTGLHLQMSVNVSMANLAALDFPDLVASLAEEAGVALTSLVLEVTESRLMSDLRAPLDILTRLRLKRIGLSIDDFGTGHSSLAQLRDIPFDELKLDQSFVTGAVGNPALKAIIEGTFAMARQLGIKSVAEGVEDRGDWDFLRLLGCNLAQGYFISRAMPGDELAGWSANWNLCRGELTADKA